MISFFFLLFWVLIYHFYNEIQSKLFPDNTRLSSVAYSLFLGIKDVLKTNQRRIKAVHERP